MVKIVTGKINSYKTTRLNAYYQKNRKGDGFISVKTMQGSKVHHYDLMQLSSKKKMLYMIREEFLETSQKVKIQIGPYCMLDSAFMWLEKEIEFMVSQGITPIYLDEIGLLELENKGLAEILKKLIKLNIDLCLVIRQDLLKDVIEYFKIKEYEVIGD